VISDKEKVTAVYSVSEAQIKAAMRLLLERMKVFVEPSACVGLAVALFDEGFRKFVETEAGEEGWNVGIVLTGGNTTIDAISKLFSEDVKG
jgi:threonine dehydratase